MESEKEAPSSGAQIPSTPDRELADQIFNGYLAAHAVWAAIELKLFASPGDIVSLPTGTSRSDQTLRVLLAILEDHGIAEVASDRSTAQLTVVGRAAFASSGFFRWALGGYADYFRSIPRVAGGGAVPGRDEAEVARGSAEIDAAFMRAAVSEYLEGLEPAHVADLGCGDGSRLCRLVTSDVNRTGIGIERSDAAAKLAQERVRTSGLEDRVTIVLGDCLAPLPAPHDEVDLVMCFFLLHDLLEANDGDFGAVTGALLTNFPSARAFVFADTTVDEWRPQQDAPPMFVRGFQLVHAMMGVRTRTLDDYRSLFASGPLFLSSVVPLGVPNSYLFVLEHRR